MLEGEKFFDPSFANNAIDQDIKIKLKAEDFSKAHKTLEEYYGKTLEEVEPDYYLFDFTDEELMEIVAKPDEWGHLDYMLAQRILRDRGKEIKPQVVELLKKQRVKDLAEPETAGKYWVYAGYFSAILVGLFGIFIGWGLAYFKRTLPDGKRLYAYREEDRNHGIRILLISAVSLIVWGIVRWRLLDEY